MKALALAGRNRGQNHFWSGFLTYRLEGEHFDPQP
jgi:hypothetical protein